MSDCMSIFDARPNLHFPISLPSRSRLPRPSRSRVPITKNRENRNNLGRRIREPVKLIKARPARDCGEKEKGEKGFPADDGETLTSSVGSLSLPSQGRGRGGRYFVESATFRTRQIASGCYFITPLVERERDRERESEEERIGHPLVCFGTFILPRESFASSTRQATVPLENRRGSLFASIWTRSVFSADVRGPTSKHSPVYFPNSTLPARFLRGKPISLFSRSKRLSLLPVNTTLSKSNGNFIVDPTRRNYWALSKGSFRDLNIFTSRRSNQYRRDEDKLWNIIYKFKTYYYRLNIK